MGQQAVSTVPFLGKQSQKKRMLARETENELKGTLELDEDRLCCDSAAPMTEANFRAFDMLLNMRRLG